MAHSLCNSVRQTSSIYGIRLVSCTLIFRSIGRNLILVHHSEFYFDCFTKNRKRIEFVFSYDVRIRTNHGILTSPNVIEFARCGGFIFIQSQLKLYHKHNYVNIMNEYSAPTRQRRISKTKIEEKSTNK